MTAKPRQAEPAFRRVAPLVAVVAAVAVSACAEIGDATLAGAPQDSPQRIFAITEVRPIIAGDARLAGLEEAEASPETIGALVGQAVIDGLEGDFYGDAPARVEVILREFAPVDAGGGYDVALALRLIGSPDRMLAETPSLTLDVPAGEGSPEARVAAQVAAVADAWAAGLICGSAPGEVVCEPAAPASAAAPG